MSIEQNKQLIRQSVSGFYNREDITVLGRLYAQDYVGHDPHGIKDGDTTKLAAVMDGMYAGFPDFSLAIDGLIGEGDTVVKRWTARGTHTGEFMGLAPTGKAIEFSGTSTYRVDGGKLAECWAIADWQTMMQQIGAAESLT